MSNLTILSKEIRQLDDMYSLNDLHLVSGNNRKNRPVEFLRLSQTNSLIAEMEKVGISTFRTKQGRNGGTFASKQLVVAYGAWISPKINLAVINAFLDQQEKAPQESEHITPEQKGHIYQSVLDICRSQNIHYAVLFGGLKRQFGLAKYDELPKGKYLEACQYLGIKPLEGEYLPKSEHPTDEQFKTDAFRLSQYALQMAHWFSDYYQPLRQLGVKRIDAMHESMDGIKIYSKKLVKGENKWGVPLTR